MLRASLAALAALLLVGVLALLIVESGAAKDEYYVAHAERMRAIETSKTDLAAVTQGIIGSLKDGRSIPPSVEFAVARLAENAHFLQTSLITSRMSSAVPMNLAAYDEALTQFVRDENLFAAKQNALAAALRSLQDESPAIVKALRELNLRAQSQSAFTLAIDVIGYATGQGLSAATQLERRIEALHTDDQVKARAPGRLDNFARVASSVVAGRTASEAAFNKVNSNHIGSELVALSEAVSLENRRTVNRAERARLLLAICTVLLLGGTGYAMLRLQSSYQALNQSNTELEQSNDLLEDRVNSRTEQLSLAYDELSESQVQLVQAEKMSSLGELVAGISHEINTPLYYLTTNSTVVRERLGSMGEFCEIAEAMITAVKSRKSVKQSVLRGLTDMQKLLNSGMLEDIDEAKDLMQDSIDGLGDLIELAQSLKDFSRLDRARQDQFNVNDGLDKTLLIAKNKLKYTITVHKYYGDVASLHCSPSQINQVFLNLITNAADAIVESGEITVRTWNEADRVCISIADTGCGIPADVLAKIRDPFFTTKEVGKGTGLGLSIVDQIVAAHDGELRVESEPGQGTTVTVVLPIVAADADEMADDSKLDDTRTMDAFETLTDTDEFEVPHTPSNLAAG